jgi:hypothetical protein
MTKLAVAFRNFANAPNNGDKDYNDDDISNNTNNNICNNKLKNLEILLDRV